MNNSSQECKLAVRENIASQLINMACRLTERTHVLADRVGARLDPIIRQELNKPTAACAEKCVEDWPTFFATMRVQLNATEYQIQAIDEIIDRLEI